MNEPNIKTPFMGIRDACAATGMSQFFIRQGCRDGTIPHVRSGEKYLVNVRALLQKLDEESRRGAGS